MSLSGELLNATIMPLVNANIAALTAKALDRFTAVLANPKISFPMSEDRACSFVMNYKVFNHDYALWFHGESSEFKSFTDSNKRGKDAPGTSGA